MAAQRFKVRVRDDVEMCDVIEDEVVLGPSTLSNMSLVR